MKLRAKNALWTIAFVVMVTLTVTSRCPAQMDTGNIAGVVTDQTGAVMPGVSIRVTNVRTRNTRIAQTGAIGEYSVPSLPVGT
jgi:hypothetical protein